MNCDLIIFFYISPFIEIQKQKNSSTKCDIDSSVGCNFIPVNLLS